jgi:23S rRNA (uracil1939-C5)-methyltransferase
VDAFEENAAAVKSLLAACRQKPLRVFRRDLFKNPLRKDELRNYDAVVFDPPRAGCEAQAIHLGKSSVPLLVGVSCNAATFARDAKIICSGGYRLDTVRVVDQFKWSYHVELVATFVRRR